MSNNEKKSSLADLLEEYFPGAGKKAEQVLNDMFADGGSLSSEETEQVSEASEPAETENVPEEIISLDGSEDDDTEDVPDEPFEVTVEEETEPAKTEELSTLLDWSEWADETIAANAAVTETFDAAETDGAETEAADEEIVPEEIEEEVTEPET
ncbi:MAG: hypothetical protein K2K44_05895 [Oscillospiraceae bacterium]|nr:hypothetical protein [Oscillospiraceae bacterium]